MELVTAYWRQDRLRGLELAALTAAADERPPTEATLKRLTTFARYGARIDKDIAKALQALRALRNRPDDWLDAPQECTPEPEPATATADPPPPTPQRRRPPSTRHRRAHVRTRARAQPPPAPGTRGDATPGRLSAGGTTPAALMTRCASGPAGRIDMWV